MSESTEVTEKILWIFTFLALYWTYCISWGVRCARMTSTTTGYFIAERRLSPWIFVLGATAISFSAWIFLGHPGLIYRDGFPYAYISLCAITIPLGGVLFLKRQWMLSRRFGYVTPGEMFSDYFGEGHGMRWLIALIAVTFAVPFVGIQLKAAGFLVSSLSDGVVDPVLTTWILAVPLVIYLSLGGLRAVAFVATLQGLLLAAGILTIGLIAYVHLGGFDSLIDALDWLATSDIGPWGTTAEGQSAYTAIPGVIQFTRGLGEEVPLGGPWTGVMILSLLLAFMGIQVSPTFSMWAFASKSPRPFAIQQVWVSAALIGGLLIFFSVAQGVGAHFLGATSAANEAGITISNVLPDLTNANFAELVPAYINLLGQTAPWFVGLLAVCGIAALQSTVAAHINAGAAMLTRDIYLRYLNPGAGLDTQKYMARILAGLMILAALLLATYAVDALVVLGALALAFGFQLVPSLAAVCWFPWITRQGATIGLAFGLIGVTMTENLGVTTAAFFGLDLPWGRWPWTIHSAVWGMFFNLLTCAVVSAISHNSDGQEHRRKYHAFIIEHAALPREKRVLRPVAWSAVLVWFFFAAGPGAVLGNDFFGLLGSGRDGWYLGMPSIWAWQIIGWGLGVLVLWFLAYRLEMATVTHNNFEPLVDDIQQVKSDAAGPRSRVVEPQWYWSFAVGVVIIIIVQWIFGG